jgi:2-hydroxychromene-2-carboxylate isomerase
LTEADEVRTVTWYFDFISPYSYFGLQTLHRLPARATPTLQPILFAGLLNHWGQKGPAEIAPKRLWTYRSCVWIARREGWPFRLPAKHPFNSLPYLRLAIAAGREPDAIRTIFDRLWTRGDDPTDPRLVAELCERLGVPAERLAAQDVKDALRAGTERAAARGVFGVPTLAIGDDMFWGSDALEFALAALDDPSLMSNEEMQRAAQVPSGADRLSRP